MQVSKEMCMFLFRHPPAAVDSVKSVAPAWGGGAHWSGVPRPDWALWRKRYLLLTNNHRSIFLFVCLVKLWGLRISLVCFWQVGWPKCSPGLILLRPSSSTSSSLQEEAGSSPMVRPSTHTYSSVTSARTRAQKGGHRVSFHQPGFPLQMLRFQAQGAERQAGYRHHGQLHQRTHGCRGPGAWDQRCGAHLQPEVLPGSAQRDR